MRRSNRSRRSGIFTTAALALLASSATSLWPRPCAADPILTFLSTVQKVAETAKKVYDGLHWLDCQQSSISCPESEAHKEASRVIAELGEATVNIDVGHMTARLAALLDRADRDFRNPGNLLYSEEAALVDEAEAVFYDFATALDSTDPTSTLLVEPSYYLAPAFMPLLATIDAIARTSIARNHVPVDLAWLTDKHSRALTTLMSVPTHEPNLTGARDWDNIFPYSCAVLGDGRVKCWGNNANGTLGDGTNLDSSQGTFVMAINNATKVVTAAYSTCALLSDGTVKCWGNNGWGQLGNGTTVSSNAPVTAATSGPAVDIQANSGGIFALLADHRVEYWGVVYNGYGYGPSNVSPVELPGFAGAVQISLGMNHACAVMSDDTVKCVGNNESGQLGDGSTQWSTTPVTVSGLGPASKVVANYEYTCALLLDGSAWCWGFPGHITLGIVGLPPVNPLPLQVPGIAGATDIAGSAFLACVLERDCSTVCWGNDQSSPAPVPIDLSAP